MVIPGRDTVVLRKSVWRVASGDPLVGSGDAGRRSALYRRVASVRLAWIERLKKPRVGRQRFVYR